MTDSSAEWLTLQRVAALLDVSEKTVRNRISSGIIPATKGPLPDGGHQWRIPVEWVNEQIAPEVVSEEIRNSSGSVSEPIEADPVTVAIVSEVLPERVSEPVESRSGNVSEVGSELMEHLKTENAFLRSQVEAHARAEAELRAALREALRAMPKQLGQGDATEPRTAPAEAPATVVSSDAPETQHEAPEPTHAPLTHWQALRQLRQAILKLVGWE